MRTDAERLFDLVLSRQPYIMSSKIDRPATPSGAWWIDFDDGGPHHVTVEWRQDRGFGVHLPSDDRGLGTHPDAVYHGVDATAEAVIRVLRRPG